MPVPKQWREPRVIRSTGKIRSTNPPQRPSQHIVTMDQLDYTSSFCHLSSPITHAICFWVSRLEVSVRLEICLLPLCRHPLPSKLSLMHIPVCRKLHISYSISNENN